MKSFDYSTRDSRVKTVLYILIKKKKEIALNAFDSYWKNVHGPVSARLPSQYQYWQFHLDYDQIVSWPFSGQTEDKIIEEDQFNGIAELTFLSPEDCQNWINTAAILDSDQQNFVSKAVIYTTNNGNSRTYIDRIETGDPNGDLNVAKFHVMVKKANSATVDDFRKYMADIFAPALAKSDLVLKFRLHLLDEHDNSLPPTPGVSHYEPLEKQYQAAFEIAFKNHVDLENFFASDAYTTVVKNQTKYIRQIVAFTEQNTYTFVYDGKLTLAGQRTPLVAELITNLGAANQAQDNILDLMLGKVVYSFVPPVAV